MLAVQNICFQLEAKILSIWQNYSYPSKLLSTCLHLSSLYCLLYTFYCLPMHFISFQIIIQVQFYWQACKVDLLQKYFPSWQLFIHSAELLPLAKLETDLFTDAFDLFYTSLLFIVYFVLFTFFFHFVLFETVILFSCLHCTVYCCIWTPSHLSVQCKASAFYPAPFQQSPIPVLTFYFLHLAIFSPISTIPILLTKDKCCTWYFLTPNSKYSYIFMQESISLQL